VSLSERKFARRKVNLYFSGSTGSSNNTIFQEVKWVDEHQKKDALLHDLNSLAHLPGKFIVFVSRRASADQVAFYLNNKGWLAGSIHGKQTQWQREESILKFKDDQFRVLCATSVVSRGLDFPDIALVVNYDFPSTIQDYTHRIGRTGRIGSQGRAISYFNHSNMNLASKLEKFLRKHQQVIPRWMERTKYSRKFKQPDGYKHFDKRSKQQPNYANMNRNLLKSFY